jgi:hypothetical protein
LKKNRSKPVDSGWPPVVITRENTEPKFSSVGLKTYWSGMRPNSEVGDSVGGTDSAAYCGLMAVKMINNTGRK